MGGRCFVSAGEILQDQVILFDRLWEVAGAELQFGKIEVRVSGQVGVWIELYEIVELLAGEIGLAAVVVAEGVVVEDVGRRSLRDRLRLLLLLSL